MYSPGHQIVPTLMLQYRFTSYDFRKMQRRSYYPHNQHLISTATATSSGFQSSRPGTPANDLRVENSGLRVEGDSPAMMYGSNSLDMQMRDEVQLKERDMHVVNEKEPYQ